MMEELGVCLVAVVEEVLDFLDDFFVCFESWADGFVEDAAGESAEGGFGLVEGAAIAGDVDGGDGFDFLEEAEALGGGAFAHAGAGDDFFERQGLLGAEEGAEEFTDGFGDGDARSELDEEVDNFFFEL